MAILVVTRIGKLRSPTWSVWLRQSYVIKTTLTSSHFTLRVLFRRGLIGDLCSGSWVCGSLSQGPNPGGPMDHRHLGVYYISCSFVPYERPSIAFDCDVIAACCWNFVVEVSIMRSNRDLKQTRTATPTLGGKKISSFKSSYFIKHIFTLLHCMFLLSLKLLTPASLSERNDGR